MRSLVPRSVAKVVKTVSRQALGPVQASAVPSLTTATTPDAWRRPLALFLAGLHTAPTPKPLPGPALTAAELGDVLKDLGPHRTP